MKNCYCGSPKKYEECCELLIKGKTSAESPEHLMRSRYSAFCIKNPEYIQATTDPQARFDLDMNAVSEWMDAAEFLRLEVMNSSMEGNKGTVEFKAHFKIGEKDPEVHHEISKFRKQAGVWYFRDGKVSAPQPV